MPALLISSVQADLQLIVHVQYGADDVVDPLAILDADLAAVGAVGHDLHGRAVAAQDQHAHQLVGHALKGRGDQRRNLGLQAVVRLVCIA